MIFIRLSKKYTNGFYLNGNRCTVIFLSYLGVVRSSLYIYTQVFTYSNKWGKVWRQKFKRCRIWC